MRGTSNVNARKSKLYCSVATPWTMFAVLICVIPAAAALDAALPPCGPDVIPLNITREYDGMPMTRFTALTRGRAGNAIIQTAHTRLYAHEHGGSAAPWAQFVRMWVDGAAVPKIWGPRFGRTSFCSLDERIDAMKALASKCPFRGTKIKYVPGAPMAKGRCGNDARFHQNYNYFRGRRDALRYYLATADELAEPELREWEKVVAPLKIWMPKRPGWLGENDAIVHIRISHIDDDVIRLCREARQKRHLCSLRLDLIGPELFENGTCEKHATTPPFEYYQELLQQRGNREAAATGQPYDPQKPGGWDNVWIVGEPKVVASNLVRRLTSELHMKKAPGMSANHKDTGPLMDIWLVKTAKYIIQTYGTFSWVSAYLSHAEEIHKPYTTHNWANMWAEEGALFVDDQPEYVYHNVEEGRYFLTAEQVLADKESPFVITIGERARYAARLNVTTPSPLRCSSDTDTDTRRLNPDKKAETE